MHHKWHILRLIFLLQFAIFRHRQRVSSARHVLCMCTSGTGTDSVKDKGACGLTIEDQSLAGLIPFYARTISLKGLNCMALSV